ncbi:RNA-directed DNA polymerase, eukaryota [Tanacetum coccineum]
MGTWVPSSSKLLIIYVYAPQDLTEKKVLWDYILRLIDRWDGDCVIMRDFNEVRKKQERYGSVFNVQGANLAIRGTLIEGECIVDPLAVKIVFLKYFSTQLSSPVSPCIFFADQFTNKLSLEQQADLERNISNEEIKSTIHDAKVVKDYRPISLIGSLYKIIAKILANRLSFVISGLISDVQSAFVSNRQILDGPFILNELLSWCKHKKFKAMVFKVDFEKAFDSIRWDYLQDILKMFGFGDKWCGWINGCLNSAMGSVLVNGSPTSEFQFHKGLKQGDPLSPFLFILIMESLHLSFSKVTNAGLFSGIPIDSSLTLSHLFFADDAIFVGKWDSLNIRTIVNVLKCFHLASGLKINFHKSKLMGIGTRPEEVDAAATTMGCSIFTTPFVHLGVKVGGAMSRIKSWDDVVAKVSSRLSKWKLKTLSIGGRLTLIKSVLTSIPLYHMSIFKVPSGVLKLLESIRRNIFNGVDESERKMAWISWNKVLASKKYGGLGVSSFCALNRALLFKWVWRFFSHGSCLWTRFIKAIYGEDGALNFLSSLS